MGEKISLLAMSSHTIENILSLEGTSRDATVNTIESSSLQQNSVPSPSGGDVVKSKPDAGSVVRSQEPNGVSHQEPNAMSDHDQERCCGNKRKRDSTPDGKSIFCYSYLHCAYKELSTIDNFAACCIEQVCCLFVFFFCSL